MSQKERILTMLEEAGSQGVTGNQFYAAYLPRFAARIKELRDQGYDITTRRIDGNHFVYTLHVGRREGRSAVSGGPRKPQAVNECSQPVGAVNNSSAHEGMEPGFSPPEGAPDQAQQDHEQAGGFLHDSPVSHLTAFDGSQVGTETSAAVKCGYYQMEAELDWEAA
jgi:hypothetical protein